jgi:hypothetical protein
VQLKVSAFWLNSLNLVAFRKKLWILIMMNCLIFVFLLFLGPPHAVFVCWDYGAKEEDHALLYISGKRRRDLWSHICTNTKTLHRK